MNEVRNKSEIYGKMREVSNNSDRLIKFSMIMHEHEIETIKHDRLISEMQSASGFKTPPCAISFWSRELLLLTGEIEAGARLNVFQMITLVIEKLASDALNGIFKHARAKSGG